MSNELKPEDALASYEASPTDIERLINAADTARESELFSQSVFDHLRIVSFDSQNLYILTLGEHSSMAGHEVEELPSPSRQGFRLFRVKHQGQIGKSAEDYKGGKQWGLFDEVENTSVNATKFPNADRVYDSSLPHNMLDVVTVAPYAAFASLQGRDFSYVADVVCHEIGHIEHRRNVNWQPGDGELPPFSQPAQRQLFEQIVHESELLPEWLTRQLAEQLSAGMMGEIYAMLVDREAGRRYDPKFISEEDRRFQNWVEAVRSGKRSRTDVEKSLTHHTVARLLVRVLEEQIPNFEKRKTFFQKLTKR